MASTTTKERQVKLGLKKEESEFTIEDEKINFQAKDARASSLIMQRVADKH